MAEGYAAKQDGELLVDTVSPTERAAKVNWLGAHGRIMVRASWSDGLISQVFSEATGPSVQIVAVEILETGP